MGLACTSLFSSVQFGAQEPGSPAEIAKFVADKGVKFNMMVRVLRAVQQDGWTVQPAAVTVFAMDASSRCLLLWLACVPV